MFIRFMSLVKLSFLIECSSNRLGELNCLFTQLYSIYSIIFRPPTAGSCLPLQWEGSGPLQLVSFIPAVLCVHGAGCYWHIHLHSSRAGERDKKREIGCARKREIDRLWGLWGKALHRVCRDSFHSSYGENLEKATFTAVHSWSAIQLIYPLENVDQGWSALQRLRQKQSCCPPQSVTAAAFASWRLPSSLNLCTLAVTSISTRSFHF